VAEEKGPVSIDFSTFILSLGTSAQLHLGIIEDPNAQGFEPNLDHAQQTIDMLAMLEEKTKGNLSQEETGLLKNLLYELRMCFIQQRDKKR
jgi:hypothetical protein